MRDRHRRVDRDAAGCCGQAPQRMRRLFDEVPDAPERGYLLAVDAETALRSGDLATARHLADLVVRLGEQADGRPSRRWGAC